MSKLISKHDLKTRDYLFVFDDKVVLRHCQNEQYDVEILFSNIVDITCNYSSGINKSYLYFNTGSNDEKSKADNTVFFPKSLNTTIQDILIKYFSNITISNATTEITKEITSSAPKKKGLPWQIYLFIFAVIFFIWSISLPDTVNKEDGLNYDSRIYNLLLVADENYITLANAISSGSMTDLELYELAESTTDKQKTVRDYIRSIEFDSKIADEYESAAIDYVAMTSLVADSTIDYIDDGKTSDLSDVSTYIEEVPKYAEILQGKRIEFLEKLELTEEEILAIIDTNN